MNYVIKKEGKMEEDINNNNNELITEGKQTRIKKQNVERTTERRLCGRGGRKKERKWVSIKNHIAYVE
jgi:hypothetical protein